MIETLFTGTLSHDSNKRRDSNLRLNKHIVYTCTFLSDSHTDVPHTSAEGHLLCKCACGRATKRGSSFRVCLGRGIFHCANTGKWLKYTCLKRGTCLSGKGLLT